MYIIAECVHECEGSSASTDLGLGIIISETKKKVFGIPTRMCPTCLINGCEGCVAVYSQIQVHCIYIYTCHVECCILPHCSQVLKRYLMEVDELESRLTLATYTQVFDVGIEVSGDPVC